MANVKINIKSFKSFKDLEKAIKDDFKGKFDRARVKWQKPAIDLAKDLIDTTIGKGISPVEGGGAQTGRSSRFTNYSESYRKQISKGRYSTHGKRLRPVNLQLSGKMRKSLKGRPTKEGITLYYTDKKANWHNEEGAGKSKVVRRLLPKTGTNEKLSRTINRPLAELFVKILSQI